MSIMPSTPRLRTPDRSTTSSPSAVSISGVEAVMMVRMRACSMSIISLRRCHAGWRGPRREAQAVEDEGVAGENEEQENALEDPRYLLRHAQSDLGRLAAHIAQRQYQTGDDHAQGIEPAEKRHDDGGETVARRYARLQLADGARHFADAGEAGEAARQEKAEHHHGRAREAGKHARAGRIAENADFEAFQSPVKKEGKAKSDYEGQGDADVNGRADGRQHLPALEAHRFWKVEALRIAPWPAHEPVKEEARDIDEHQARQNLVGIEAVLQIGGYGAIEHAAQNTHGQHDRQDCR